MPDLMHTPDGCDLCDHTGYKGRVGVFELLQVDDSIRSILRGSFKPDLLRNTARSNGMRRLQEDALDKVLSGISSLEEIQRVVPFETLAPTECDECGHELLAAFRYCPYCGSRRSAGGAARADSSIRIPHGALTS